MYIYKEYSMTAGARDKGGIGSSHVCVRERESVCVCVCVFVRVCACVLPVCYPRAACKRNKGRTGNSHV